MLCERNRNVGMPATVSLDVQIKALLPAEQAKMPLPCQELGTDKDDRHPA